MSFPFTNQKNRDSLSAYSPSVRGIPKSEKAVSDSLSLAEDDPMERIYFRRSLMIIMLAMLLMLFFFLASFFLAAKGAERTVVPSVVDESLNNALIKLQERELYPRLLEKYTGNPRDKGTIISQDPVAGSYVRAGRRVVILVSLGAVVEKVEDYSGMTVGEVRRKLASQFSNFDPLLFISETITHVYAAAAAGTVISQSPPVGQALSEPAELFLVVSRGALEPKLEIPLVEGLGVAEAISLLASIPLAFEFRPDTDSSIEAEPDLSVASDFGVDFQILDQSPEANEIAKPGEKITLTYQAPSSIPEGNVDGLFEYQLPEYPVLVPLNIRILKPDGEEENFIATTHPGGAVSFPYRLEIGSAIIVYVNQKEIYRYIPN